MPPKSERDDLVKGGLFPESISIKWREASWGGSPTLDGDVLKVNIVYKMKAGACTKPTVIGKDCKLSLFTRGGSTSVQPKQLYNELMDGFMSEQIGTLIIVPLESGDMLALELSYGSYAN